MSKFVERKDGVIVALFANPQPGRAEEELPSDHPEIVAYKQPKPPVKSEVELRVEALETAKEELDARVRELETKPIVEERL